MASFKKVVDTVCQELTGLSGKVATCNQYGLYRIASDEPGARDLVNAHSGVTGSFEDSTTGLPCGACVTDSAEMVDCGISAVLYGPGVWRTEPNEKITFDALTSDVLVYELSSIEVVSSSSD